MEFVEIFQFLVEKILIIKHSFFVSLDLLVRCEKKFKYNIFFDKSNIYKRILLPNFFQAIRKILHLSNNRDIKYSKYL